MRSVRVLCQGLNETEHAALSQAIARYPTLHIFCAGPNDAGTDADLALFAGASNSNREGLPAIPVIGIAMTPDAIARVAARHPLLLTSRARPSGDALADCLQSMLRDWHISAGPTQGVPQLAPETVLLLQEQFQGLSRSLISAGAISAQMHLAEHRLAPMLVLGPGAQDCIANAHAEGLGAVALRGAQDVLVLEPAGDARALAGLDYPEASGELPLAVVYLGTRQLAGQDWTAAVTLRALGSEQLRALLLLTRALADALWPVADDVFGGPQAARRLYRPVAMAALQDGDREIAWPAFAPAWTRRFTRIWRWPLLLSPLLLWLPVAPSVSGSAQVIYADAPPIVSPLQASVVAIAVAPGASVRSGDVLLRLLDPAAEQQLDQAWADYRALLRQSLREPEDQSLAMPLAQQWERVLNARGQRELAVLAPVAGRVVELPATLGLRVEVGALLALVQPEQGRALVELQIPLQGMLPVEVGAAGWLVLADGSERAVKVRSLGALLRAENNPSLRIALAEFADDVRRPLPGERGVVHLSLPARPLYQHIWYALGGARR